MKILKNIICLLIVAFTSTILVGCKNTTPPQSNINVTFAELQNMATTSEPNNWSKISAKKSDTSGTETILINKINDNASSASVMSTPTVSLLENKVKIDYVKENNAEKVYCKDNVRHHKGKDSKGRDRNYIDESEFDAQTFINETISEYLYEMLKFFSKDNSALLTYSDKKTTENTTIIEFRANIDKTNNTEIKVELKYESETLIKIKLEISSNDKSKEISVELSQTTEVVNTPEWFDNDDFKTPLTYEQVKAVVLEEDFNDWDSAELFLPVGYSDDIEDKNVFTSRSQNQTYTITDTQKEYFDGIYLYTYTNDEPSSREDISSNEDLKQKYSFDNIIDEYKTFTYGSFFANEPEYEEYYQAAKKYEKDITVISYKYFGTTNNVKFESICSLYYDIDNNLYQILCYAKQIDISDPQNEITKFELNLSLKKTDSFTVPSWFDASDFD